MCIIARNLSRVWSLSVSIIIDFSEIVAYFAFYIIQLFISLLFVTKLANDTLHYQVDLA